MKKGRPQSVRCTRGHLMKETRRISADGNAFCFECKEIRNKKYRKLYPKRYKHYQRTANLRRIYGLEVQEFKELLNSQSNKCAICDTTDWGTRNPHVDHDHESNLIRGILCSQCNRGLGLFKDNIEILKKAIRYLSEARKGKKK